MNKADSPRAHDKTGHKSDPKETAQEVVHQVMSKDAANKASTAAAKKNDVKMPLSAAKGDDDLMSQPPGTTAP